MVVTFIPKMFWNYWIGSENEFRVVWVELTSTVFSEQPYLFDPTITGVKMIAENRV